MIMKLKQNTIYIDEFKLKCAIGKGGIKKKIKEGDKITPRGLFSIGDLFYRADRIDNFTTKLTKKKIKKDMGWCDDPNSKNYNRLIKLKKHNEHSFEKLFKTSKIYDFIIPIKYNYYEQEKNKGSAIFIHLTKDYKPTLGCIALKKKDFLIMLNLIDRKTKIKIY
tara:strand:- start:797 stop:1291 length:495 start_codon:yes stop_codon:yes gene_type:complete